MAPIGSLLWRSLRVYQIYGANTEVGKTVFTTLLSKASRRVWSHEHTGYLKPVSTGPQDEADDEHLKRHAPDVNGTTLLQYDQAVSPHIAARGKSIPKDHEILSMIHSHASKRAAAGPGWLFIETAGGVHSPAPSGVSQADLYLPLRCPVVLVGDSKLGGISLTISAFESLKMRGYDVESVLLFQDDKYGNHEYLQGYFQEHFATIPVTAVPKPPPSGVSVEEDADAMSSYYQETSRGEGPEDVLRHLDQQHQRRIRRLAGMAPAAHKHIWYPFTQHKSLQAKDIVTIDSANGDFLQTLVPDGLSEPDSPAGGHEPSLLQPSFDGSASWWTQGLGHANPSLTLAAAHAAGRYGHAMFAGAVHEPALALAEALLGGLGNPRLSRVFYSDNGSTGMEVAVKMALRAARVRYGWPAGARMGIVGLRGGYHGDTMGVMDCAEPSTFNEQVEWYEGKGVWLDYPTVWCSRGTWHVGGGAGFEGMDGGGAGGYSFKSLSEIFDLVAREKEGQHRVYEQYILDTLRHHVSQGRKFGALVIEPVVIGAGGMALVDPLFQRTLVNVVRQTPNLFGHETTSLDPSSSSASSDPHSWTGLPIVFDEVFTGLYRLGRFTASSFLGADADIQTHAKLLTGGLVPLCATLASDSVFGAFAGDDKAEALLHGHSYTAHPVGCRVAVESLRQMRTMEARGDWDWTGAANGWGGRGGLPGGWDAAVDEGRRRPAHHGQEARGGDLGVVSVSSIWPRDFVDWVSHRHDQVAGVWALGSVLAIHMVDADGSGGGYTSTASLKLQQDVLRGSRAEETGARWNVHSRVLGNVLYLMGSQKTTRDDVDLLAGLVRRALA